MTPTSGVDGGGVYSLDGGVRSLDGAAARRWVTVWFTRKNYPKHRALDPSGLPSTFDEWLANAGYEVYAGLVPHCCVLSLTPPGSRRGVARPRASPTLRRGQSSPA